MFAPFKSNMEKYMYYFAGIIALLVVIGGLGTALYFTINYMLTTYGMCVIEEFTNRNCYEQQGRIYMEQYFAIDNNRIAFVNCGPVADCLTSPCNKNIYVNVSYECKLYSENLYALFYNPVGFGFIAALICILILAFIIGLIITIFYCVKSYNKKHKNETTDVAYPEVQETNTKLEVREVSEISNKFTDIDLST